jgi:hypothetical protein
LRFEPQQTAKNHEEPRKTTGITAQPAESTAETAESTMRTAKSTTITIEKTLSLEVRPASLKAPEMSLSLYLNPEGETYNFST